MTQIQFDYANLDFIERYKGDVYMILLQKKPSMLISHFICLPKEIQEIIAMKYYENQTSNVWSFKINDLKALIEVEVQEMWMEHEFEMGLLHIF